jgi:hypothetical protein
MDRDPRTVHPFVASPLRDHVEVRLHGSALAAGRVPLGAASEALKNSRRLLSSSGTSALAPGWTVAQRYRHEAKELARDTELAHTRDGSFIFPLFVPLNRDESATLFDDSDIKVEPFERRVTRTLATGLEATSGLLNRDIDELSDDELNIASSVGVTKELCISLDNLLKSPAVDGISVRFEWSPAFGSTGHLPATIEWAKSSRDQIQRLERRLSRPEPVRSNVYSGPIRSIGHEDDDLGLYSITLDTSHNHQPALLQVLLSAEQHASALPWYAQRSTVVVKGTVARSAGVLRMDRPERVNAWSDELF